MATSSLSQSAYVACKVGNILCTWKGRQDTFHDMIFCWTFSIMHCESLPAVTCLQLCDDIFFTLVDMYINVSDETVNEGWILRKSWVTSEKSSPSSSRKTWYDLLGGILKSVVHILLILQTFAPRAAFIVCVTCIYPHWVLFMKFIHLAVAIVDSRQHMYTVVRLCTTIVVWLTKSVQNDFTLHIKSCSVVSGCGGGKRHIRSVRPIYIQEGCRLFISQMGKNRLNQPKDKGK